MKANKQVQAELIRNLDRWFSDFQKSIDYFLEQIKKADTVEEIMQVKKDMLINMVNYIPSGRLYCYFCIENDDDCSKCQYGKLHGKCGANSDYHKIGHDLSKLKDALKNYYKGEQYDDTENR